MTGQALREFSEALAAMDAREVAEHPDLIEVSAQARGFYSL